MKSKMVNFGDISVPGYLIPPSPHDTRPALEHPDSVHERRWKDRVWLRDEGRCQWCRKFEEAKRKLMMEFASVLIAMA
jgi:hypothetical protein